MLLFAALTIYTQHRKFALKCVKDNVLQIVSEFMAAASKPIPCAFVSAPFALFTNNLYVHLKSPDGNCDKTIKLLEKTKMLGQYFRCVTQLNTPYQLDGISNLGNMAILDALLRCSMSFVSKKLCPGEPTGEILNDILKEKDGYRGHHNPQVTERLKNLQQLAVMANHCPRQVVSISDGVLVHTCRNCGRCDNDIVFQKSLLVCSRCNGTFYCNKECQVCTICFACTCT